MATRNYADHNCIVAAQGPFTMGSDCLSQSSRSRSVVERPLECQARRDARRNNLSPLQRKNLNRKCKAVYEHGFQVIIYLVNNDQGVETVGAVNHFLKKVIYVLKAVLRSVRLT